jgi:hypothetical protein
MTRDQLVAALIEAEIDREWAAAQRLRFFPDADVPLADRDRAALLLRMTCVERIEDCSHHRHPYREVFA